MCRYHLVNKCLSFHLSIFLFLSFFFTRLGYLRRYPRLVKNKKKTGVSIFLIKPNSSEITTKKSTCGILKDKKKGVELSRAGDSSEYQQRVTQRSI